MSKKPPARVSARAASPSGSPKAALTRIAELVQRGGTPDRVSREVAAIVAGWLLEAGDEREDVRERLAECRDELSAGVEDAMEQVAGLDASDKAAMRQGTQSLAALVAARDALNAAYVAL
ncbi:MAG: hypothetical protein JWP20_1466 [Roseomonas sp.]|nr:hypothetical protein [Roseomonas sp.]